MIAQTTMKGFETELIAAIGQVFRFSAQELQPFVLKPGRNLFAQDMPEPAFLDDAAPAGALPYDKATEPAIAFYRQPGTRTRPSSFHGGTLEISLLAVLRAPRSFQGAVDLLDELGDWMAENAQDLELARFKIGGIEVAGSATPFSRGGDDASFASSTLRILAVNKLI